ncbi:ribosomal RNA processing protein 1 A-like [Pyrus ussuriensis x Pyrus communis]|uniref:Ribosomal RNA processing protein 1 A-like n=1 Tax=Pyrus ussuriensis x Pyrus communis TaxID=2448454 RepID=A0A5N5GYQ0_9ROSA|nr:ribosomal RNA processing protein 1 A-like [Pyrus ussuriensis x Pyrus communis]
MQASHNLKPPHQTSKMEADTAVEAGLSLIKQLASCNKSSRDRALRVLLKTWLPAQLNLQDDHMKKLWKGLFYCLWHADKVPVQTQLIDRLSSLVLSLHLQLSLHYFSVFLLTMRREWPGIDALRLDKFYLSIRRFMTSFFTLMRNNLWDLELVKRLMGVLEERTFLADDKCLGNGVNYHIASVFLEELRPFLPIKAEVLEVLIVGFIRVSAKVPDKVLLGKIKSNLFDVLLGAAKRLLEVKKSAEDLDSSDEFVDFGTVALKMGFASKFYESGSSPECCQGNRKVLFGLHEEFLMLEKELESSGVEISLPDVVYHDDEEVPDLVPLAGEEMDVSNSEPAEIVIANGSAGKRLKKCKKNEKDTGGADTKAEKKKKKKKKNKEGNGSLDEKNSADRDNENVAANGETSDDQQVTDADAFKLDDNVISNLQLQFEKIAADAGLDDDVPSACDLPLVSDKGPISKKRKRMKKSVEEDAEGGTNAKSGEKSAKKVKFSMKNNLVWKPQTPLPPQDLRLPPSATPRGSALKKGVPPGPIWEMPTPTKKVKMVRVVAVKKARKSVKRVKKLKSRPT